MKKRSTLFYATPEEQRSLIRFVCQEHDLIVMRKNLGGDPFPPCFDEVPMDEWTPVYSGKRWLWSHIYLLLPRKAVPVVEAVPQQRGGVLYEVGHPQNPHSIRFHIGQAISPTHLLQAGIDTSFHDVPESRRVYECFRRLILKSSRHIEYAYVSRGAEAILRAGGKLTQTPDAPPEYHMRIPK